MVAVTGGSRGTCVGCGGVQPVSPGRRWHREGYNPCPRRRWQRGAGSPYCGRIWYEGVHSRYRVERWHRVMCSGSGVYPACRQWKGAAGCTQPWAEAPSSVCKEAVALTVPMPSRRALGLSCLAVVGTTSTWELDLCSLQGSPSLCHLPGAPLIGLGWAAALAGSPLPTLLSQMLLIPPCPPLPLASHTPRLSSA